MAIIKGKPDGGSGGRRGHSNMDHWMFTDEIKAAAKKARRLDAKEKIAAGMGEFSEELFPKSIPQLRIVVSHDDPITRRRIVTCDLLVTVNSSKRLTTLRVARILAQSLPCFLRRKGRYSRFAGAEILPVLEASEKGWRAWRLCTGDDNPSGFEPPLPGRVGKLNSKGNPFADRKHGLWENAEISIEPGS
jgi:hypothetical protein